MDLVVIKHPQAYFSVTAYWYFSFCPTINIIFPQSSSKDSETKTTEKFRGAKDGFYRYMDCCAAFPYLIVSILCDNTTSAYHDISLTLSAPWHLMPSWFYLIGIALILFPILTHTHTPSVLLQMVLYWIQLCSLFVFVFFVFLPTPLTVLVQPLDPPSLKCLLNNVDLVQAHSSFFLALSPGLCY